MNSNYISTQSLYDSGAHLAHAKQYSHKYIKREPDGKGGYRYYYKTDLNVNADGEPAHVHKYSISTGALKQRKSGNTGLSTIGGYGTYLDKRYDGFEPMSRSEKSYKEVQQIRNRMRQADKASQIYSEGQSQNTKDYQSHINRTQNEKKTLGDYAKQTLNTISSAAGSAYDKGKKFIQGLFK